MTNLYQVLRVEVIESLVNTVDQKNTVMREFIGGRHVEVLTDFEPMQKIHKFDPADAQGVEEEYFHKSESPHKLF